MKKNVSNYIKYKYIGVQHIHTIIGIYNENG